MIRMPLWTPLLLVVSLLPAAAAAAAGAACTTLTGWWDGNGILQQGSALSVVKGDVTTAPGMLQGGIATFYFKNMCGDHASSGCALNATISANCKTLSFTNGAVWHQACADPPGHLSPSPRAPCGVEQKCCAAGKVCARTKCIEVPKFSKIHVVYMTHLDLGFTNSTRNVCDTYFDVYFPAAFETAAQLRASCSNPKTCPTFRWTEFPWIIQEFLDGGAGCAHSRRTVEQLQAMIDAIGRDDIIWHANAVNFLTEVLDEGLWDYSLSMKDILNQRFNKSHGQLVGKLTDTTGMSKNAIPMLSKHDVKAFHIGYNGVGGLPDVDSTFVWRHNDTGTQLVTFIEDRYGLEIDVPASASNQHSAPLETSIIQHRRKGGVTGAASDDIALVFLYTVDNSGPPTAEQVTRFWQNLQQQHPHAEIIASSLDDFAAEVLAGDLHELPVVTEELGDSWLYGAPADPIKVATFREARRFATQEIAAGRLNPKDNALYDRYMRRLMKGPCEHNWGYSVGGFLPELRYPDTGHPEFTTWPNTNFHAVRDSAPYQKLEAEWAEQREWMHPLPAWSALFGWSRSQHSSAVLTGVLPPSVSQQKEWNAFVHGLEDRLAPLMAPSRVVIAGMEPVPPASSGTVHQCGGFDVQINSTNGAISSLVNRATGRVLAKPGNNLGTFHYMTFSAADFAHYGQEYVEGGDFGKTGMESANVTGGAWAPSTASIFLSYDKSASHKWCHFVAKLKMPIVTISKYGAPNEVTLNISVPGEEPGAAADISLLWHDKTATRIAEAMWLSFVPPAVERNASWTLDVMGHPLDPLRVANGGTRFKHAVQDGGATLHDGRSSPLQVRFLDSAILAPGDINHLLRFCRGSLSPGGITDACADAEKMDVVRGGVHANLLNNLWGTAFPQWYDDDSISRFQIFG